MVTRPQSHGVLAADHEQSQTRLLAPMTTQVQYLKLGWKVFKGANLDVWHQKGWTT